MPISSISVEILREFHVELPLKLDLTSDGKLTKSSFVINNENAGCFKHHLQTCNCFQYSPLASLWFLVTMTSPFLLLETGDVSSLLKIRKIIASHYKCIECECNCLSCQFLEFGGEFVGNNGGMWKGEG